MNREPLSSRLENEPFPARSVARTVRADAIVKLCPPASAPEPTTCPSSTAMMEKADEMTLPAARVRVSLSKLFETALSAVDG